MISFIIGVVATFYSANGELWASPLSKAWFGGADLTAFAAPIVTGIVYYLLSAGRISAAPLTVKSAQN